LCLPVLLRPECSVQLGAGVAIPNDLAACVDAVGPAVVAAQGPEVGHRPVLPQESVPIGWATTKLAIPNDLAASIDAQGRAVGTAQGPQEPC